MAIVFSNSDVVSTWAERSQSHGTNQNRTLFFEYGALYSYGSHYKVAEFIKNDRGEEAVFINDRGYSPTTGRHIALATYATSEYLQFFATETRHALVHSELSRLYSKVKRARKPELYTVPAVELYRKYLEYCKWSGLYNFKEDQELLQLLTKIQGH